MAVPLPHVASACWRLPSIDRHRRRLMCLASLSDSVPRHHDSSPQEHTRNVRFATALSSLFSFKKCDSPCSFLKRNVSGGRVQEATAQKLQDDAGAQARGHLASGHGDIVLNNKNRGCLSCARLLTKCSDSRHWRAALGGEGSLDCRPRCGLQRTHVILCLGCVCGDAFGLCLCCGTGVNSLTHRFGALVATS